MRYHIQQRYRWGTKGKFRPESTVRYTLYRKGLLVFVRASPSGDAEAGRGGLWWVSAVNRRHGGTVLQGTLRVEVQMEA